MFDVFAAGAKSIERVRTFALVVFDVLDGVIVYFQHGFYVGKRRRCGVYDNRLSALGNKSFKFSYVFIIFPCAVVIFFRSAIPMVYLYFL